MCCPVLPSMSCWVDSQQAHPSVSCSALSVSSPELFASFPLLLPCGLLWGPKVYREPVLVARVLGWSWNSHTLSFACEIGG